MRAPPLETENSKVQLVEPNIDRDAPLSVGWLEGETGRRTLALMGVAENNNRASSLDKERERIKDFIEENTQLNWMIRFDGKIVGSIWVDLSPTDEVPAPAIHIMIGDPTARGQGVGAASTKAVLAYLRSKGETLVYSRSLSSNDVAAKLLADNGFHPHGESYSDSDGLRWQNVVLDLSSKHWFNVNV